jgi:hypothetical protein
MTVFNLTDRNKYIFYFLLIASVVIITESFVTGTSDFRQHNALLSFAVAADLVIGLPLIFYFLVIRKIKWSVSALIPVFLLSAVAAWFVLPEYDHSYLLYIKEGAVFIEVFMLVFMVIRVRKIVREFKKQTLERYDFTSNIQKALVNVSGDNLFSRMIASEITLIRYGLFFWLKKPGKNSENHFSIHEKSGFIAMLVSVIFLSLIEAFVLHLVLVRYSKPAAWVLTFAGIYSTVFLVAYLNSVIQRPVEICNGKLYLRSGILWSADIDLNKIASIEPVKRWDNEDKTVLNLAGAVFSEPVVIIRFKEPVTVNRIYGFHKTATQIGIVIDEKDRFISVIKNQIRIN